MTKYSISAKLLAPNFSARPSFPAKFKTKFFSQTKFFQPDQVSQPSFLDQEKLNITNVTSGFIWTKLRSKTTWTSVIGAIWNIAETTINSAWINQVFIIFGL